MSAWWSSARVIALALVLPACSVILFSKGGAPSKRSDCDMLYLVGAGDGAIAITAGATGAASTKCGTDKTESCIAQGLLVAGLFAVSMTVGLLRGSTCRRQFAASP